MNFWWWFWVAYGVGCVLTLVPATRWMQRELMDGDDDAGTMACTVPIPLCVAPMWPLLVPGVWMFSVLRSDQREREQAS